MILQISSGRGPVEVRRFVALLAKHIALQLAVVPELAGDPAAPLSARLTMDTSAAGAWVGTHVLVAPLRGHGRRKRWFVEVRAFEDAGGALGPRAVVVTAARAGGPGGQHVNKRATAVRAVDVVSGVAVRVAAERSQARNRAVALRRLGERLDARIVEAEVRAEAERRAAHDTVERGRARFSWRLDGGELTPSVAASAQSVPAARRAVPRTGARRQPLRSSPAPPR